MNKLSELQQLDKVSLAEVEKIIEIHNENQMYINRQLNEGRTFEELKVSTETLLQNYLNSYVEGDYELAFKIATAKKILLILEQMKAESAGDKNV